MFDHRVEGAKRIGGFLRVSFVVCLICLVSLAALGVEIDGVKITLHSSRYYSRWDMTRFIYRVKSADHTWGDDWILGVETCVADALDEWSSSYFEWVDTPWDGMRFDRYSSNQKFYVWLTGQWEVGAIPVAVTRSTLGGEDGHVTVGSVDGPVCSSAGLSLEIIQGNAILFPELADVGYQAADEQTRLEVVTSSTGWMLSYDLGFDLPPGASEEAVRRVFEVAVLPFVTGNTTTEVDVGYAVDIGEDDLVGLPQGEYSITIRFTVSTD